MSDNLDKTKLNIPSQLIIIGGGFSLKEGISKGVWTKLKEKFTIGINYSYRYFESTLLAFVDKDFYIIGDYSFSPKEIEKHINALKTLPLIIGKGYSQVKIYSNTIILECNPKYYRDIRLGIYKDSIAGLFSLSLGIYLLDVGTIFLLGFDYGSIDNKSHFYQGEINHRGIDKTNYYDGIIRNKSRAYVDFSVYRNESKVKIYNVSLQSEIPEEIFPKISYNTFFKMLDNKQFNQNELRNYVRNKLKE